MFKEIFNFIFLCMTVLSLGSFMELRNKLKTEAAKATLQGTLSLGAWSRKLDNPKGLYSLHHIPKTPRSTLR